MSALALTDVRKSFGATEILRGVSLTVNPGERHAVIGPNGAGKSTLFHLISGRLKPSSGEIRLAGQPIHGLTPHEINWRGLARSFQVSNLFPRLSVFENLRCSLLWHRGLRYCFWRSCTGLKAVNEEAEAVMERIHLAHRRATPAGVLSYAEQRALEIGMAIAPDPAVLLLDEPTAGMSHSETEQAVELIRTISAGKTLVMVEHDMGVVFGLAERISVLVYGQIIATDTPERIRADANVQAAYLGTEAGHA